jgi:acetyl-CoA acetyltransferase
MTEAAAIIGVGESDYSWASGKTEIEMALNAIRQAIADAGLSPADVDGLLRFSFDNVQPYSIAEALGIQELRLSLDSASGAASAATVLAAAQAAINAGQAEVIVCYRSFNGRSMMRLGHLPLPPRNEEGHVMAEGPIPFGGEFTGPYGMAAPACAFGLWANAYMQRHGISEEKMSRALGTVVSRQRNYASRNPNALLRNKPMELDDYLKSPLLAAPLRKADLCLESDGACAFVVAGKKFMTRAKHRPVYIWGTDQRLSPNYGNFFFDFEELPPRMGTDMMPGMLRRFGISHADINVLGIYDASSSSVIYDLENLGFCNYGDGVELIADPGVAINTSGGLLAEVYLQGMNLVIELVRQLRGLAWNQVKNARFGALSMAGAQAVALLSHEVLS